MYALEMTHNYHNLPHENITLRIPYRSQN